MMIVDADTAIITRRNRGNQGRDIRRTRLRLAYMQAVDASLIEQTNNGIDLARNKIW